MPFELIREGSRLRSAHVGDPAGRKFIACLSSLVVSLLTFIFDIHLSLVALKLEIQQVKPDLE